MNESVLKVFSDHSHMFPFFQEFVKEQVDKAKKANGEVLCFITLTTETFDDSRAHIHINALLNPVNFYNWQAEEAREKEKEGMSEETKEAYKEMKLYKFYPSPSPNTPDLSAIDKVQQHKYKSLCLSPICFYKKSSGA